MTRNPRKPEAVNPERLDVLESRLIPGRESRLAPQTGQSLIDNEFHCMSERITHAEMDGETVPAQPF